MMALRRAASIRGTVIHSITVCQDPKRVVQRIFKVLVKLFLGFQLKLVIPDWLVTVVGVKVAMFLVSALESPPLKSPPRQCLRLWGCEDDAANAFCA